jgi:hypothetical protein
MCKTLQIQTSLLVNAVACDGSALWQSWANLGPWDNFSEVTACEPLLITCANSMLERHCTSDHRAPSPATTRSHQGCFRHDCPFEVGVSLDEV